MITIFKQEAYQEFLRKNKLTKELHKAVNQQFKGFEVYFQPIIDMKTEKIHSMEALLRFECGEILPNSSHSNLSNASIL